MLAVRLHNCPLPCFVLCRSSLLSWVTFSLRCSCPSASFFSSDSQTVPYEIPTSDRDFRLLPSPWCPSGFPSCLPLLAQFSSPLSVWWVLVFLLGWHFVFACMISLPGSSPPSGLEESASDWCPSLLLQVSLYYNSKFSLNLKDPDLK